MVLIDPAEDEDEQEDELEEPGQGEGGQNEEDQFDIKSWNLEWQEGPGSLPGVSEEGNNSQALSRIEIKYQNIKYIQYP